MFSDCLLWWGKRELETSCIQLQSSAFMPGVPMQEQPSSFPQGQVSTQAGPEASEMRYHAFISKLDSCPAHATLRCNEPAYRVVHSDLKHPDNFVPQAVSQPDRLATASDSRQCGLWSLSLYRDPQQLRNLILKMEKTSPKFRKIVGDHYVKLDMKEHDGRRTPDDQFGHFNFYEYTTFDAHTAVQEHGPLFP